MLANRVAIVSGGGSGIGRAVANLLSKQQARVLVLDQNIEQANATIRDLDGGAAKHHALQCDVSKSDSIRQCFEDVQKHFGCPATMLANCAGITKDGWMVDMTEDAFDRVIQVNLKGTFLMTQLACKKMIDAKVQAGSVVNVTSVSAKIGNMGQANYVSSKAAVEGLTRTVAREMGRYNIRCNVVMPGFISTPMIETVPDKGKLSLL